MFRFPSTTLVFPLGKWFNALRHVILGVGRPLALHCKISFCLSSTMIEAGLWVITAPTTKEWNRYGQFIITNIRVSNWSQALQFIFYTDKMPLTFVIENAVRKRGGNDNDVEEEIVNNCNSTSTAVTGTFIYLWRNSRNVALDRPLLIYREKAFGFVIKCCE